MPFVVINQIESYCPDVNDLANQFSFPKSSYAIYDIQA